MAYELTTKAGYVQVKFMGQLTVSDLTEVAKRLDEMETTGEPSLHRYSEISDVEDIQLNFAELQNYAARRQVVKLKNKVKSAIVARSPLQYGFARMFQMLNRQPQIDVAVFHDSETALQWILGKKTRGDHPA